MEMGMRGVKGEWAREQRFFTFASSPSPSWASQAVLVVKNLLADAGEARNLGSIPESGRSRGERTGSPLQYSRLENPHGQRSLAGYSLWGRKELDVTERFSTRTHPALLNTALDCFIGTSTQTHLTPSSPLPTPSDAQINSGQKSKAYLSPVCHHLGPSILPLAWVRYFGVILDSSSLIFLASSLTLSL